MTQSPEKTDLEGLRALLAKATPGPWAALDIGEVVAVREAADGDDFIGIASINGADTPSVAEDEANAELIATLRNSAEALLDELTTLRQQAGNGVPEALKMARDLVECIEQTCDNVWWVNAYDPETAVCNVARALDDALTASSRPPEPTVSADAPEKAVAGEDVRAIVWRETQGVEWKASEDVAQSTRVRICAERRAYWRKKDPKFDDDECDHDGRCSECDFAMAEAHETEASKAVRAAGQRILAALATPKTPDAPGAQS